MKIDKNSKLQDYVRVYKNVISEQQSKLIIDEAKNFSWKTHEWASYTLSVTSPTLGNDFQRVNLMKEKNISFRTQLLLKQSISKVIDLYMHETDNIFESHGFSPVQLNRYDKDTLMHKHIDHIASIFDGTIKGIPTLSVLGLLHSDFKGGDFIICNDLIPDFKGGDIMVFPSVFLYPHEVTSITEGERYSFVSWVY